MVGAYHSFHPKEQATPEWILLWSVDFGQWCVLAIMALIGFGSYCTLKFLFPSLMVLPHV
jgi:hypothetical protein